MDWYVEESAVPHLSSAAYNAGWRRQSTAYGAVVHTGARFTIRLGIDAGLPLQHDRAAGHKYPGNAVSIAAMSSHKEKWSWTQPA